jgi:beta-glucosidase
MPWARNPNVTVILAAHYPGEQSGSSIVDVLWDVLERDGRLLYTILQTEADYGFLILNVTGATDPDV